MNSIPYTQRYLPHEIDTRYYAVKLYRTGVGIKFVCRRYHISKASLMRWNKRFDGTKDSLRDKSHRSHTPHPAAHTEQEIKWIRDTMRRNPNISVCELYGKLRIHKGYSRHPGALYRILSKLGLRKKQIKSKKRYSPKPYDTPTRLGVKWQMDVKFIPKHCYCGSTPDKFYQYTVLDDASRERFIFPYMEHSSHSSMDFLKKAIAYFGYVPAIIQTDNGGEFTHVSKTNRIHPFTLLCQELGIEHKLIRPRTPRHNGKVERSHRNDQERFYNHLSFYSYDDLLVQMQRYLLRSNNIPMKVLGWKSPREMRHTLSF